VERIAPALERFAPALVARDRPPWSESLQRLAFARLWATAAAARGQFFSELFSGLTQFSFGRAAAIETP
jgi:hypothetical protein